MYEHLHKIKRHGALDGTAPEKHAITGPSVSARVRQPYAQPDMDERPAKRRAAADAFSVLMAPRVTEEFHLRFHPVLRKWHWTWSSASGQKAPAPSAWSAQTSRVQLRCSEPCFGAPVTCRKVAAWCLGGDDPPPAASPPCPFPPSVLKSAVQKCVRRCMPEHAVMCAAHLLDVSVREFARRMIVICIEDAILHPGVPLLAWAMLAESKGYHVPPSLAAALLQMVYEMAACRTYDAAPVLAAADAGAPPPAAPDVRHMSDADAALVRSLLVRAEFGGMGGDVRMLREAARIWTERFLSPAASFRAPSLPTSAAPFDAAQYLVRHPWHEMIGEAYAGCGIRIYHLAQLLCERHTREYMPAVAIDFHCTDMLRCCMATHAHLDENDVRMAIWYFRSSENTKTRIFGSSEHERRERVRLSPVWDAVQSFVERYAAQYVARRKR